MRKMFMFMLVSVDGYFEGVDHDISWHNVDDEFNDFAIQQLGELDTLLFGRKTYELMASYWPTKAATTDDPIVAGIMNSKPKIVVSRTLSKADWHNTRLANNLQQEIDILKRQPGKDIGVFGSNNLCVSLIHMGLLDEIRIIINPVILGSGNGIFSGLKNKLNLQLEHTKTFKSGNVLLYYKPFK